MVDLGTLIHQAKAVRCGEGNYPVLSMTMHDGLVFQNDKFKKTIASKDKSDYKVVKRNQLVISFPIDEGVLATQRIVDAGIVSPAYGIWDIDQEMILPEFLEYALRCDRALNYYKAKLRGSTARRRSLPTSTLLAYTVPLPDISEQEHILNVVHKTQKVISGRTEEISLLDNLIKARFVEMFGDPVSNDRGWNTAPLETVCKAIVDCPHSTPSYTDVDTGYLCIRTSIVKKNRIMWDEIEYIPEHEYKKRIQRKRPEKGDIVYTREGAILGIAAIIDRECNVALGQRSMLLSPDTAKCLPQFLCVAMNFDTFLRKALKGLSGSASPHINVGDIKAFTIIVPPMELQNQFAVFVEQVDKSKVVVQKALDEAQTLFDSLMQEYFG